MILDNSSLPIEEKKEVTETSKGESTINWMHISITLVIGMIIGGLIVYAVMAYINKTKDVVKIN